MTPLPGIDPLLEELGNILLECMLLPQPRNDVAEHLLDAIEARIVELGYPDRLSDRTAQSLQPWQEVVATRLLLETTESCAVVATIAAACGMSPTQFCRAFRVRFGCTPQEWRVDARIARAKQLMRDTSLSLTQIALDCGFAEQSHFNHTFARRVGSSPGAWRRGDARAARSHDTSTGALPCRNCTMPSGSSL